MNPRDRRVATFAFVTVLSLAAFAVNACGARAGATAGPETAQVGPADSDETAPESDADADADVHEAPASDEDARVARAKADVDPFSHSSDAESNEDSAPERDAKGRKKLKAPDSNREPLLKKPPAKPKPGSLPSL